MRFRSLRRHWEGLGRRDPLWAVLTDPGKRGGGWDPDEFFRTGDDEIRQVLDRAAALGVSVSRRRALDFGCGVGRLTQALAARFERADGVDISASMLRQAARYNRHPDTCTYHLNPSPDLARFGDSSFTFVYSVLVLQHMEPRYSRSYVRELVRVLAPGGLLVFQVPSRPRASEVGPERPRVVAAPLAGSQSHVRGPLPPDAFRARITADPPARPLVAAEPARLEVTVENASPHVWPALPDGRGRYGINLANHWLDEGGRLLERDDARGALPYDVAPGKRVTVTFEVMAPRYNGAYWLELDLVQEGVSWFAEQGSPVCRVRCLVGGGLAAPAALSPAAPAGDTGRPFRDRHPRVYRVARATRLRDLYWAWRRGLDDVRARRDRVLRVLKPPVVNAWRRLRKRWRTGPFAPYMEMYCLSRDEVVALVAAGGGRVVDVEERADPHFEDVRYWVVKEDGPPDPTPPGNRGDRISSPAPAG